MSLRLSIENHIPRLLYGDEKAIEMIAQAGFDAIDFSFYWMPKGESILDGEDYLDRAEQLRACAEKNGIVISQAHAPFDLKLTDHSAKQAYDYEQIRRSIEFAGVLGAECIVIHNLPVPEGESFFNTNLKFFQSFEETARKSGIKIGVENLVAREENRPMPGRLGTPSELNAFLDRLNPDIYCACVDLGHAQLVFKDPAEFIREIDTPRLQSIHVQDTIYHLDAHTLPYLGRQDWNKITRALAKVGYNGDFTLEVFLFLKSLPKEALPDALKLAHTVGRSLIHKIELDKVHPDSIAEHYLLDDAESMKDFLNTSLPEWQGDYLCPSGDTLHLYFSEYEPFSVSRPEYLFRLLSSFPYCEKLPTIEQIYSWIPEDFPKEEISECMQWMDKIYAFFCSPALTGLPAEPPHSPVDFFIADDKLITCFQVHPEKQPLRSNSCEVSEAKPSSCRRPLAESFVRIPDTVTEIYPHAFYNCDMPVHIYLPASVKKVAEHAFYIEPDSGEELYHRLFFIEHETGDVEFKGAPFNFRCWFDGSYRSLVDSSFYAIVAPPDSRAHQFAVENSIDYAPTIKDAIEDFLSLSYDFEESRDDAGSFTEVQELFRKGEIAARYAMRHANAPNYIVLAFCRIAFGITSHIRGDTFSEDEAVGYLMEFNLEKSYFEGEELNDRSRCFACTAAHLMRRNSPNLESALLSLDPDSVAEYITSLEDNPNYNSVWCNMFFDGQEHTYSNEEFFALGDLCARIFIANHAENWEDIFDAAISIAENLTDKQRHGHFRLETLVRHLAEHNLDEAYFKGKDLTDCACAAVELMRSNSPNLERAVLALDPYYVSEYIESLESEPDCYFEQDGAYSEQDFFALGNLCACVFVSNHAEGWEDVFDASLSLARSLSSTQRYDYFRIGDIELWNGRPIPTDVWIEDNEDEEDESDADNHEK